MSPRTTAGRGATGQVGPERGHTGQRAVARGAESVSDLSKSPGPASSVVIGASREQARQAADLVG